MLYEIAKTADVFLTNYLPAAAPEEQVRRRAHPRGQPEHHLRARQRLRRQGAGARRRRLRRHRLLDAQRRRPCADARGARWRAVPGHPGVRRFDRRHEHRRRHLRRAVPSRAHRRGRRTRRLAAEHRLVGGGRQRDPGHGDRRDDALADADAIGPTVNPFLGNYRTSDGGTINLCIVSPTGYIRDAFEHLGLPEAADDPRFADVHAADRERRRPQRTDRRGDPQQAVRLLARAPEDDEGPVGAVPEPHRPRAPTSRRSPTT